MDTGHTIRNEYELLDSGGGRKLERFGEVILARPCGQAVWEKQRPDTWDAAVASFDRERGWQTQSGVDLPSDWIVTINDIRMRLAPTAAGHLGVFPETRSLWDWIGGTLESSAGEDASVLNLFAHSGGATVAAAKTGCAVCHVDSSKAMVARARDNAALNQLEAAPVRWIVEDVVKFLGREVRRGRSYDAIMLDPPSFGHGTKGEQYRIDRDLTSTLEQCRALLSSRPAFVLLTAHTQGVSTSQLEGLLDEVLDPGEVESGSMQLTGEHDVRRVNAGVWARWTPCVNAGNRQMNVRETSTTSSRDDTGPHVEKDA